LFSSFVVALPLHTLKKKLFFLESRVIRGVQKSRYIEILDPRCDEEIGNRKSIVSLCCEEEKGEERGFCGFISMPL